MGHHRADQPVRLSHFRTGHNGTHRNKFDEHSLLHLAARAAGYEGMILMLVDVSDPAAPREVGRFAMSGQDPGATDSEGVALFGLHGPSLRVGDLAYLPYGNLGLAVVDVADPAAPRLHGHLQVRPPLGSQVAAHSAVPLPRRNMLIWNSEAIAENCEELPQYTAMVDIADPAHPRMMSLFPAPVPDPAFGFGSFCAKGGRFGPHNQHIGHGDPNLNNDDDVRFLTHSMQACACTTRVSARRPRGRLARAEASGRTYRGPAQHTDLAGRGCPGRPARHRVRHREEQRSVHRRVARPVVSWLP